MVTSWFSAFLQFMQYFNFAFTICDDSKVGFGSTQNTSSAVGFGLGNCKSGSLAATATFEPKLKPNKCHTSSAFAEFSHSAFPQAIPPLENTHSPCWLNAEIANFALQDLLRRQPIRSQQTYFYPAFICKSRVLALNCKPRASGNGCCFLSSNLLA